jgi:glycosyltransferase involved in cell wall biosynthesis
LKCLIESENYSIIHFYNSFGVYNVLKECWNQGARVRIVETVHSDLVWGDSMTKVSKRDPFVSAIAAVSNNMAKKLLKFGNNNVIALPQFIDWERFENMQRSKDILKELNIPTDFVVGFVGRLSPEKNVPMILECAKRLPEVSFVIVGGGPQEMPLKQMAASLKNVFFIGARQDVEKYYAAFDVLILPSHMEGMPLVILEAMATGTPVIATDVGGISEVVNNDLNGCLVWNSKDIGLFVSAINFVRDDVMREQLSNNSIEMARAMKEMSKLTNINIFYNKLF